LATYATDSLFLKDINLRKIHQIDQLLLDGFFCIWILASVEKLLQVKDRIPSQEEVKRRYDPSKERLRDANYYWDRIMANSFERQKKESL
jgi:hypothetical protein